MKEKFMWDSIGNPPEEVTLMREVNAKIKLNK
jgi:hypothetical protein